MTAENHLFFPSPLRGEGREGVSQRPGTSHPPLDPRPSKGGEKYNPADFLVSIKMALISIYG